MANSKELMLSDSVGCPEFIQDLLPSAEQTALLYHLSYLCLGGFPRLESLIRERALETQMLFASSGAVLLKCVSTSDNLVTYLFPMLMHAVENNEPSVAVKHLEKARSWIHDIIKDEEDMVYRYDKHNTDVAKLTNEIIIVKYQTEKKQQQQTGQLPNVIHLDEVLKCLSRIQMILIQLKRFLEKVGTLLDTLKDKTIAGEDYIEFLEDSKEDILESVNGAKQVWTQFSLSCMKANGIFSVQANDAYKFFEVSPSSLSKEDWEKEYNHVKDKLENIKPNDRGQKVITH
ncbi:uncharacterized protein LOC130218094 [Danio aesculapii]|uniref:uncharacterized protein LOC130218094 n=1 Tax=Danio aesculapii TaxID=1142201 RepID=UPI0024C0BF7A|nr:uncharacterized protein LOC130218094 [Danio aesculapii]